MATNGEKRWPPVGNFVAASGEKPMAIDTGANMRRSWDTTSRENDKGAAEAAPSRCQEPRLEYYGLTRNTRPVPGAVAGSPT